MWKSNIQDLDSYLHGISDYEDQKTDKHVSICIACTLQQSVQWQLLVGQIEILLVH